MTSIAKLAGRAVLWSMVAVAISSAFAHAFDLNDVGKRAAELAANPFQKPAAALPKELSALDYDQYWGIRFRSDRMLWRGTKQHFETGFFHQGMYYDLPVRVHEVTAEGVSEVRFDPEMFDYGQLKIDPAVLKNVGFAGLRVRYPFGGGDQKDDLLMFLGATYFRAMGRGQYYGSYARGFAVDTGLASGEEFPRFTEFWIERPTPNAKELVMYALMDSPRVTGAYRFVTRPGIETAIDVTARVFLREGVGKFGMAPLATMYFFGKNQRAATDDYRPQVHNAEGLSVALGNGEWVWRPLVNPKRLLVTSFGTANPQGFGLMQRDRDFTHYEDLEARYELRPSVWVEPKGAWGAGRVELVQIPVPDETNSNVIAFWVPEKLPQPKEAFDFEYRLIWQRETDMRPPLAYVAQTRRGRGYARNPDNSIAFTLDFVGDVLRKVPPDARVESVVNIEGNAELVQHVSYRNEVTGGFRVVLRVRRIDENKPVELRALLRNGTNPLSETWSYVIPPG